jgi:predicted PurR-regulated permease PerM
MSFPPPTIKQARILWFCLTSLAVAVLLGLLVLFVWGLGIVADRLSSLLLPIALALLLAYVLDPVVEFFVRKKLPRVWAILLVFLLGFMVVGGVLGAVIPGMIRESRKVIEDLPRNTQKLQTKLDEFMETSRVARFLPASWHASYEKLVAPANSGIPRSNTNNTETIAAPDSGSQTNILTEASTNMLPTAVTGTAPAAKPAVEPSGDIVRQGVVYVATWIRTQLSSVTTWVESSVAFVLLPICLFYFLLEKQRINRGWADYLPLHESKVKDEVVFVLRAINDCMIVFFRGQVLVALCVGTLLAIGYLILGLNYAVLLGLVAGVLGIVPYLGTIVSLVLALTVAGIQFGDWTHPLIVVGVAAVVKLLEDLVISPKIIGERSGLHPLTVILAVMIGANLLGGFLGALIAIPLTAVLRTLMFRYVWKRRPGATVAESSAPPAPPGG